jgi:hypothetical protein
MQLMLDFMHIQQARLDKHIMPLLIFSTELVAALGTSEERMQVYATSMKYFPYAVCAGNSHCWAGSSPYML